MKLALPIELLVPVAAGLLLAACAAAPPAPGPGPAPPAPVAATSAPPVAITPPPPPPPTNPADLSDTVSVLASDFAFGPGMDDADVAARYYCTMKGKEALFLRRDAPPELRAPTMLVGIQPTFTVMTYRCVTPH